MSNRGNLVRYCPAHDYGDPGYPPEECPDCIFEADKRRKAAERRVIEAARELRWATCADDEGALLARLIAAVDELEEAEQHG